MKPLSVIYAIKIILGVLAATICILLKVDNIINGAAVSILVYLVADKILKQIFIEKVETQSTVTKTGIGVYIMTWLLLWILLFTWLYSPA